MAAPERTNTLCSTPLLQEMYQRGKEFEKVWQARPNPPSSWSEPAAQQDQKSILQQGYITQVKIGYTGYIHASRLLALTLDALEPSISPVGQDGHTVPLKDRIAAIETSYKLTLDQLVSGQCPEANDYIQRIVDARIAETLAQQQEQLEQAAPLHAANQITQEAIQNEGATPEERLANLRETALQLEQALAGHQAATPAENALGRLVALIREAIPPNGLPAAAAPPAGGLQRNVQQLNPN